MARPVSNVIDRRTIEQRTRAVRYILGSNRGQKYLGTVWDLNSSCLSYLVNERAIRLHTETIRTSPAIPNFAQLTSAFVPCRTEASVELPVGCTRVSVESRTQSPDSRAGVGSN